MITFIHSNVEIDLPSFRKPIVDFRFLMTDRERMIDFLLRSSRSALESKLSDQYGRNSIYGFIKRIRRNDASAFEHFPFIRLSVNAILDHRDKIRNLLYYKFPWLLIQEQEELRKLRPKNIGMQQGTFFFPNRFPHIQDIG